MVSERPLLFIVSARGPVFLVRGHPVLKVLRSFSVVSVVLTRVSTVGLLMV